jgi:predicted hydrocarbon binding protein
MMSVVANSNIKGEINQEVIDTLSDLMAEVLGKNIVKSILRRSKEKGTDSGAETMFAFAQETQNLLGEKGSYATLRQVGRSLAKKLMAQYPENQWDNILRQSLNDFGFANYIDRQTEKAFICQCVFYDILVQKNLSPIQHAVCWAGWGFIEGFVRELEQGVKSIEWVNRDVSAQKCEFTFKR